MMAGIDGSEAVVVPHQTQLPTREEELKKLELRLTWSLWLCEITGGNTAAKPIGEGARALSLSISSCPA